MRVAGCIMLFIVSLTSQGGVPAHSPLKGQLVGAWRLVAIEYRGPGGEVVDPFYQAGSSGIIIYDASGWMSVQIGAPDRRGWDIPSTRMSPPATGEQMLLKAQAFDTYYSYYGTWDYDAASSVVTHHVKASVIPAEAGLNYSQSVTLEKDRLVFSVSSGNPGARIVRRKVWERLNGDSR